MYIHQIINLINHNNWKVKPIQSILNKVKKKKRSIKKNEFRNIVIGGAGFLGSHLKIGI